MSKHTPGPWTSDNSGCIDCVYARDALGADRRICEMIGPDSTENATLIAAAPELLESLQRVEARLTAAARAFYGDGKRSKLQSALTGWKNDAELARAAIAKAIGN